MKVPVGPASIVGYILTALGTAGSALAAAEGNLHTAKWLAILGVISGVVTNLGRQLQAGRAPLEAIEDVLDPALGITHADVTPAELIQADEVQTAGVAKATL